MTRCRPKSTDILGVWGRADCVFLSPADDPDIVVYVKGVESELGRRFGNHIADIKAFVVGDVLGVSITWVNGAAEMFSYTREMGKFAVRWSEEPVEDEASLFEMALDLCQEWRPRHVVAAWLGH